MWMALRERVCAIDEINMATMRMRLRHQNELPADPPQANIVEPAEVISLSYPVTSCGYNCLFKSRVEVNIMTESHTVTRIVT